jgi:cytochrome c-type biogenesis protein CcmH
MKRTLLAAALVLMVISPAARAGYGSGDPRLEKLYAAFVPPCCWRDNLMIHDSPTAAQMRARIDEMVQAGKTDEEITSIFVAEYGERILVVPRGRAHDWLFWTPWFLGAVGLGVVVVYLRRLRHAPAPEPGTGEPHVNAT